MTHDRAGDTNEAADLKECEPSAADVHACIHKFGLFRENENEEEAAADAAEGDEPATPAAAAAKPAAATSAGGGSVQAASPSKGK